MKIRDRRNGFSLLDVIVIVIITGIVSALTTGLILFNGTKYGGYSYLGLSNDNAVNQFLNVYSELINEYYEDINTEEMIASAINGMFEYLGEDYSTYLNESETQALAQKIAGYYDGVGISIRTDNVIDEVHEDGPAEKAGILTGDKIVRINESDVTEFSTQDITSLIKTFGSDNFTLTVLREDNEMVFNLKREKILYPVVTKELKEENGRKIGYIYLSTFSKTAAVQIENAIAKLEEEGMESLIIDLRYNSGGLLSSAEEIAGLFLEVDKVIYSLEEKSNKTIYKDKTSEKFGKDVAVLINGGSASASEILAAALKESYGAVLVGEKTYGKGKVQQTSELDNGTMVKYTTARWLTPAGNCIDGIGIAPDYEVLLPEIKDETAETLEDTQLNKALEILAY